MEELAKRKDIIITNADKGGAVVIMDVEKYINEANRQLFDKRNYEKLQDDPTLHLSYLVNGTILKFKKENLLSTKLAYGLKFAILKTPNFYISPKIHQENKHYPNKTISTKIIATFLALILTLKNFIFNSKFYLQIKGCAIGTICTPSYANIFMSEFEENHMYLLIKNKSAIHLRYIDDIFMVWIISESELGHFMDEINQKYQSIKFDFKFSKERVKFLDTLIYIDSKNRLQITLYK